MLEDVGTVEERRAAVELLSAWALAGLADCMDPDSGVSPGARMLESIRDAVLEEVPGARDLSDAAHEIADQVINVYTVGKWQQFTDLGAWAEDVSEFGPIRSLDDGANAALYLIGDRLARVLLEHLHGNEGDA